MTQLLPNLAKIDVEVITVLVFLLVSLASWLKEKFSQSGGKKKTQLSAEQEALREAIWRRQMGEETTPMPWGSEIEETPPPPPRTVARDSTPPPVPVPMPRAEQTARVPVSPPVIARQAAASPPPIPSPSAIEAAMRAPRPVVSAKQAALAQSFERIARPENRRGARNKALIAILRRPESARQAILLQEILGPPVTLRQDPSPSR